MRKCIIEALIREGVFNDIIVYIAETIKVAAYVGMGSGTNLFTAPFHLNEGVPQGGPLSSHLFGVGTIRPFKKLNATLADVEGAMTAIMDDNISIGPPGVVFPAVKQMAADVKEECGLDFRPDKSCAYMRDDRKPYNWDELRGDIPEGIIEADDGSTYHGISICNIPVGHQKYVETYLKRKKDKIGRDFHLVEEFLEMGKQWTNPSL